MVNCYGYGIWRQKWQVVKSFWGKNTCFFKLLSTIKVNIVAKTIQSAYLCVIFHVKHKKLLFLAVLTWFLIFGKIEDGGQDGDHCLRRHRPPAAPPPIKYTSSCREDQMLSTKGKIVSKYCNISKTPGRGFIHPPLSQGRVWICMYVRGLSHICAHNFIGKNVKYIASSANKEREKNPSLWSFQVILRI